MTISNTSYTVQGNGDGNTTVIPFPFLIFVNTDLQVYLIDSSGNQTLQTLGSQYSVTINPNGTEGGSVNFVTAPPIGCEYFIERVRPFTQPTDLPVEGSLPAPQIEAQLDSLTMLCIQINGAIQGLDLPGSYPNVINIGNPATNGSWRFTIVGTTLVLQTLVGGVWTNISIWSQP